MFKKWSKILKKNCIGSKKYKKIKNVSIPVDKKLIENIGGLDSGMLVYDQKDRPVILVNNEWSLNWILERNPGIQFLTVPSDVAKI